MAANAPAGGNVLMLRIVPGVDVLETRCLRGQAHLQEKGLKVVGEEFTEGDNAKTKSIVEDYLAARQHRRGLDGCRRHSGRSS